MALTKPQSIESHEFKNAKWGEITANGKFSEKDTPALELLCQWYAISQKCIEDIDYSGELNIAYQNDNGDIKAMPQVAMLKQASAEIRALNKQLGICDEVVADVKKKETKLYVIQQQRQNRSARAAN